MQPAYQFTQQDRMKGAQASLAVQRERIQDRAHKTEIVDKIVAGLTQAEVSNTMLEGAEKAIRAATDADPELDTALDALRMGQLGEILFKMYRLATDQSTSNAAHATLSPELIAARLAALEAEQAPTPPEG